MELVRNHNGFNHGQKIEALFRGADDITFCVAFVKERAVRKIKPYLEQTLQKGGTVTAYCGTDFFLTEPGALEILLKLQQQYPHNCHCFVLARDSSTFHPKVYVATSGRNARCIVGSCNLTAGAMSDNIEVSLEVEAGIKHPIIKSLHKLFATIGGLPRCQSLTDDHLKQYKVAYTKARTARDRVEVEINNIEDPFVLTALDEWCAKYHNSQRYDKFQDRAWTYRAARRIQNKICALNIAPPVPSATRTSFDRYFRSLIMHGGDQRRLWWSSSLSRKGSQALKRPVEMVKLFRAVHDANRMSPVQAFVLAMNRSEKIPGVGLNMVTEIMATFRPKSHAIVNGITTGALTKLGFTGVPSSLSKRAFKSKQYKKVLNMLELVRRRIGASDFLQTDSFLYFVYSDKNGSGNA